MKKIVALWFFFCQLNNRKSIKTIHTKRIRNLKTSFLLSLWTEGETNVISRYCKALTYFYKGRKKGSDLTCTF